VAIDGVTSSTRWTSLSRSTRAGDAPAYLRRVDKRTDVTVSSQQAWFWTDRWQEMEREVDDQVGRGETDRHDGPDDFIAHIDGLSLTD